MSLISIIQESFGFSEQQSRTLLEMITLGKDWNVHQWIPQGKGPEEKKVANPEEIRTQRDLLVFFQVVGQSKYFGGHNRAEFKNDAKGVAKELYFELAQNMGMTDKMEYKGEAPSQYLAVHGSGESSFKERLSILKEDLIAGSVTPEDNIIFALGTTARGLGKGVKEQENESKEFILAKGKSTEDFNELEMVIVQTEKLIAELKEIDPKKFGTLTCVGIDAKSVIKDRMIGTTATTPDTVIAVRNKITELKEEKKVTEQKLEIQHRPSIIFYSNFLFGPRQHDDARRKIGEEFHVYTASNGISKKAFLKHPIAAGIFTSELARLMNNAFNAVQSQQSRLETLLLNEKEMAELKYWKERSQGQFFGRKKTPYQLHQMLNRQGFFTTDKERAASFRECKMRSRKNYEVYLAAEYGKTTVESAIHHRSPK